MHRQQHKEQTMTFPVEQTREFREVLRDFSEVTYERGGNYNYACGYLESLCAGFFAQLNDEQRAHALSRMRDEVERNQKLARI
jgi:hypothetical protein